jgi:hypothetical protein
MKKILMLLAFVVTPVAFAAIGTVTQTDLGIVSSVDGNRYVVFSGSVSGTGSADTSSTISTKGYVGVQFKIVKTAYRGTLKLQGSREGAPTSFTDIWESSNDSAAVTETIYWQEFDGWDNVRFTGDPNGSNAGTATCTMTLIYPGDLSTPRYTGYYGPHTQCQELLASAARTADVDGYFYYEGKGVELLMNTTAIAAGGVTLEVWEVSPTGVKTFKQSATAITAVTTTVGNRTIILAPDSAPVTNTNVTTTVEPGAGSRRIYYKVDFSGTDSTTFSLAACPLRYSNPVTKRD